MDVFTNITVSVNKAEYPFNMFIYVFQLIIALYGFGLMALLATVLFIYFLLFMLGVVRILPNLVRTLPKVPEMEN